jgi:UDP-glucose 4-epimerase
MRIEGGTFGVIGGAGFIGSHIVEQLLARGARRVVVYDNLYRGTWGNLDAVKEDERLTRIEGDLADIAGLQSALEGCGGIFHLAAAWLKECLEQPRLAVESNILGTYNVLEACRDLSVERLVYSSSASVYGDALETPMTEAHPYNNRTLYGATKIAGEHLCRSFNEMYGLDYVGLRYMNVYGPRQDYLSAYTSVIMKVLDRVQEGQAPQVFGDGSQTYDFVHVRDVARANLCAMESTVSDECYNVGTGIGTTLKDLVEQLLGIAGASPQIEYVPQGQTFVTQRIGSTKRAIEELGFTASIGLEEGLRDVIEWRAAEAQDVPA